jgi:hypothetical protein
MLPLTTAVLGPYALTLVTHGPSCADWPANNFFMLVARSPQGTVGYVAPPEPSAKGDRGIEL